MNRSETGGSPRAASIPAANGYFLGLMGWSKSEIARFLTAQEVA
jgi:hypothetical protein